MPEKEHLEILKRGVDAWNEWRESQFYVRPNLREADLKEVELHGAYLGGSDLSFVDLRFRDLSDAQLENVNLSGSKLDGADLSRANLVKANLFRADLVHTNLTGADLHACDLRDANLTEAVLIGTVLNGVILNGCNLSKANLNGAKLNATTFGDNNLQDVIGLEAVVHVGPSVIGLNTIYKSKGKIPESFLRGCGVPESLIVQIPALVTATQPIQFYSCFISHSSYDREFAERLYIDLQARGVRCWIAPEAIGIGARFRPQIDEAIRVYDKLLVVLSENSVHSWWVKREVETALELERAQGRQVLFPLRIDDEVMKPVEGWQVFLLKTRQIGDFKGWKSFESYQRALSRLLRDLTLGGTEPQIDTERVG
ncbi:MAG: toll/interleukin-1 receptor domain-containing protein [Acidobacteria bacterium]|nr:toll/interleukin-1 receptor domain-containing protein [Acidobacteriota bacterium]